MAVVSMVVGAVTDGGATFVAKVDGGGPVRVAVADNEDMSGPVFTASQAVDAQGVAKVSITGLDANTRYWWRVEDNSVIDDTVTGQLLTYPTTGAVGSFTVGIAGDAGLSPLFPGDAGGELDASRVSNSPTWLTIADRAVDESWHGFIMPGDFGYPDWGDLLTDTVANRRLFYDDNFAQSNQAVLWRSVGSTYFWDDHDFAGNNSDGTYANKANGAQVYRERFPHYTLDDANAIYQEWPIARVQFVGFDVRYNRDPNSDPDGPSKTMLGAAQMAWLEALLGSSTAELLVIVSPSQWLDAGTGTDSWASFATEQNEIITMLGDTGWLNRVAILGADAHMNAIDTGGNSPAGIPTMLAASIDATPLGDPTLYNLGGQVGRNQYGTLQVQDFGSTIAVRLTTYQGLTQQLTYGFGVNVSTPVAATGALLRTLPGAHRALFNARLLTTFQSGDDPTGTELAIIDGEVVMDATTNIQRTLSLEIPGRSEDSNESLWPRRPSDQISAYGDEIFVQRGVDLGGAGTLMFPLGYFRIESLEQDDAPYGPIRIIGLDRMAGIIDAVPLEPRQFLATDVVAVVFAELVGEVYPDAIIVFDDDSAAGNLGRDIVMEDSRYEILAEIAKGLGKVMFWDDFGFLQVVTAPDENDVVWEVRAGWEGVLISSGRRITREGIFNGWVFTGEGGASNVTPARGVAVDNGPNSPTRWGGRFGKVPGFFSSPTITSDEQAEAAAREQLRLTIGAPYSVNFGSVVHPGLRPYQAIRLTQQDANRELHVMQRLTIPLVAQTAMTGDTREKTQVVISSTPEES